MAEVRTEDLRAKIAVYEAQLSQVEDGDESAGLRDMLTAVLNVTKELVKSREGEPSEGRETPQEARDVPDEKPEEKLYNGMKLGSVVEVMGGQRAYAGVITAIYDTPDQDTGVECKVKYFEYEGEVGLKWDVLKPLEPGDDVNKLVSGDPFFYRTWRGKGKYPEDQKFYECTIDELTKHGAIVSFRGYEDKLELPLAYLRTKKSEMEPRPSSAGEMLAIPEKFRILDTDSAEQRKQKLMKTKALRKQNKAVQKEKESAVVQQNWQKFVAKGARKNLSGMGSVLGKGTHDPIESSSSSSSGGGGGSSIRGSSAANNRQQKRQRFH